METTPASRSLIMDGILQNENFTNLLQTLHDRWQDEKKYEDFKEYQDRLAKELNPILPQGSKIIGITKRFVITMHIPGFPYLPEIFLTDSHLGWRGIYQKNK